VVGTTAFVGIDCEAGDSRLYTVDLAAPKVAWTGEDMDGQHLAVSADGNLVARQNLATKGIEIDDAGTGDMLTQLDGTCYWDAPRKELRDRYDGCRPFPTPQFPFWAQDMQFAPDASAVVGLDQAGYLVAWDPGSGRILGTLEAMQTPGEPPEGAFGFVFTPDGREIIVGIEDGEMLRYSTDAWAMTGRVPVESVDRLVTPIGFVDGGRTLLAVAGLLESSDGWVYRLDASTFQVLGSVYAHTAGLKAATVSPDGTSIATADADGRVKVWDADTLELQHELRVPGQAQGVAFVDEHHLAVVPEAGDVLIMILDRQELLTKVRSTLSRGFTEAECEQYGFGSACPTLEELRSGSAVAP
jgi:WD40 repeat protein